MGIFFLLLLCIAGIFLGAYVLVSRPNSGLRTASVSIGSAKFNAEIADTILARTRGLSGRSGLPEDGGMLFIFPSSTQSGFWMKDMRFAIDIVWIRGSKVIGITENLLPEPGKQLWALKIYYPPEQIDTALEVNAGAVKRYELKAGDSVSIGQ